MASIRARLARDRFRGPTFSWGTARRADARQPCLTTCPPFGSFAGLHTSCGVRELAPAVCRPGSPGRAPRINPEAPISPLVLCLSRFRFVCPANILSDSSALRFRPRGQGLTGEDLEALVAARPAAARISAARNTRS